MTKTGAAADVILPSTSWASTKASIPQRTAASSASLKRWSRSGT